MLKVFPLRLFGSPKALPFDFDGEYVYFLSFQRIVSSCLLLVKVGVLWLFCTVLEVGSVVGCLTCLPHCEKLPCVACLGITNF